jgi:hypothetical protein
VIGFKNHAQDNAAPVWQTLFEPVIGVSQATLVCLDGLLICTGVLAFSLLQRSKTTLKSQGHLLHRCAAVHNDAARLICYDRFAFPLPAKGSSTPAIARRH